MRVWSKYGPKISTKMFLTTLSVGVKIKEPCGYGALPSIFVKT